MKSEAKKILHSWPLVSLRLILLKCGTVTLRIAYCIVNREKARERIEIYRQLKLVKRHFTHDREKQVVA